MLKSKAIKKIETLGKEERIKSRKTIGRLFNEGKSFSSGPIKGLYFFEKSERGDLKCGFTVSSRTFKSAVDRNRIKRLLRECYRKQKSELKELQISYKSTLSVFIIFRGSEVPEYNLLFEKIGEIIKKLISATHENFSSGT